MIYKLQIRKTPNSVLDTKPQLDTLQGCTALLTHNVKSTLCEMTPGVGLQERNRINLIPVSNSQGTGVQNRGISTSWTAPSNRQPTDIHLIRIRS